jgi:hypothetical protein
MKKKFFIILLPLFLLGWQASGFCNQQNLKPEPAQPKMQPQMMNGYNTPARIDVKGNWDFWINASLLYWKSQEDGLMPGMLFNFLNNALTYKEMDFDYKPGFKVGIGMTCKDQDDWTIGLDYTRYHITQHSTLAIPDILNKDMDPNYLSLDAVYNILVENGYSFLSSAGRWKNNIDLLDLNLMRPFYSGQKLTVTPLIGLRGGWMNQYYYGAYSATDFDHQEIIYNLFSKSKQTSYVVGPRAGLLGNWILGKGFSILGNVDIGLLYQKFHNRFSDRDVRGPVDHTAQTKQQLTTNLELGLGLNYGTYFAGNKAHVDLSLLYNFQMFTQQNRMIVLVTNETITYSSLFFDATTPPNLYLHGFTLNLQFDF